jgi:ubiquinone/menaquinone biosynthesis C-methylase UbiE
MSAKGGDVTHFSSVDQTSDPGFFIEFLEARKTIEGEREVKELIIELLELKPGARVLDVGCGTGDDAREIAGAVGANGRVVGIDPSETMIAESKKRAAGLGLPVEFLIADVRKLNFPAASFDFVRTDRVLMFVPEIQEAISEIVRVLRPGGRVVASELDHEMHFQDSHFPDIIRKVCSVFAASQPHPHLGRQLHRLLAEQGLRNVKSVPRVLRPPYKTYRRLMDGFLDSAIARGQLAETEISAWLNDIAALNDAGLFNDGVVVFTASGEKP